MMAPPVTSSSVKSEPFKADEGTENFQRPVPPKLASLRDETSGADARAANASPQPTATGASLIRIEGDLRRCSSEKALWQHLANEPIALLPFEQALVFTAAAPAASIWPFKLRRTATFRRWKATAISGLANVNRDSPMTRWYENIASTLWQQHGTSSPCFAFELPSYADPEDPCTHEAALRFLLWVPLVDANQEVRVGWMLARNVPWEDAHKTLATRLAGAYAHGLSAIEGRQKPISAWRRHLNKVYVLALAAVVASLFIHIPLTTLAPVEVTPQDPLVMAAPMPGVVERLLVAPGAQVNKGTPLVQLIDTQLSSEFEVATQKLEVARAKMLRLQQASVEDVTAKRELAIASSEESVAIAERDYASAMLDKTVLRATQSGVALYGDPRDWVGRPVNAGEAIMRVADPERIEFQIKVPVSDAVNLHNGARVKVFLDAAPLDPLEAKIVRAAYKAETDAAGVASFTVTARAVDPNAAPERLGLRGTARIYGDSVSLMYYLLRRPVTAVRQWSGI